MCVVYKISRKKSIQQAACLSLSFAQARSGQFPHIARENNSVISIPHKPSSSFLLRTARLQLCGPTTFRRTVDDRFSARSPFTHRDDTERRLQCKHLHELGCHQLTDTPAGPRTLVVPLDLFRLWPSLFVAATRPDSAARGLRALLSPVKRALATAISASATAFCAARTALQMRHRCSGATSEQYNVSLRRSCGSSVKIRCDDLCVDGQFIA